VTKVADIARLEKRLFSIKEAAVYLGRSPWTVAEMTRTGQLPYVKDSKRKLLDILDLDLWIEKSKIRENY
jgi:excisionase family DNA binding protein